MLFSKRPAQDLTGGRVLVSRSSMTSVALVELLFEHIWQSEPQFVLGDAEMPDIARFADDNHDARLVIGDAALKLGGSLDYPFQYDLGQEWKNWTGQPFVFAVWVAQRTTPVADALRVHAGLIASRDWGIANTNLLAEQANAATGIDRATCVTYLAGLDYGLSYPHLAGLTEFFRRLVLKGQVPDGRLAFLPAA